MCYDTLARSQELSIQSRINFWQLRWQTDAPRNFDPSATITDADITYMQGCCIETRIEVQPRPTILTSNAIASRIESHRMAHDA
jgi:hypothetical protein